MKTTLLLLLLLMTVTAAGAAEYSFEALGGVPITLGTSLTIRQEGHPDLEIDGDYVSEPFTMPPYYALRLTRRTGDVAWSLDMLHHKVILEDLTDEVTRYEMTHGYNIVSLHHVRTWRKFDLGAGVGVVIARPENSVRGRHLDEQFGLGDLGYTFAGPAFTLSAGRRLPLNDRFFLVGEGRFIVSWVNIPVDGGDSDFSEQTAHLHFGAGVNF